MGDFFKPWRRKVGVMTLVMACVFMAFWVRSKGSWPKDEGFKFSMEFMVSGIEFHAERDSHQNWFLGASYDLLKFSLPYWSITIPLTFISLWLLLSKPRKSTQEKLTEPIPAEGT